MYRANPAILPAEHFGHNPEGSAKNANSNIKAQRKAGMEEMRKAASEADRFNDNLKLPKRDGKGRELTISTTQPIGLARS